MARRYHADEPGEAERLIHDRFERQDRASASGPADEHPRPTSSGRDALRAPALVAADRLAGFRDAALAAEARGWDSVWTWDHLMAIFGPWEQPIFEGWSVLAALGPLTPRVRLGLMVGANTFRNPGLTAKLATTLDHVSGRPGRPRHRRRLVRA